MKKLIFRGKKLEAAEEQRKPKVREHEESESRNRDGENHHSAAGLLSQIATKSQCQTTSIHFACDSFDQWGSADLRWVVAQFYLALVFLQGQTGNPDMFSHGDGEAQDKPSAKL